MCESCVAATELLKGNVLPNWHLEQATKDGHLMKSGDYGLCYCNGPAFIFSVKPWADPTFGLTDEQVDAMTDAETEAFDRWADDCIAFESQLVGGLDDTYRLMRAAEQCGFNPDDRFAGWFFHYLSQFV